MTRYILAALLLSFLVSPCSAGVPLGFWTSVGSPPTSYISNIQPVSITIASGQASGAAAITAVNMSNSVLFNNGFSSSSTSAVADASTRIELTNSTTVTCYRGGTGSDTATCNGTVITFTGQINSVQAGTIALSSVQTSNTAAISTVSSNAFVIWLGGATATAETSYSRAATSVALTNATTVTASIGIAGATMTVGYMVVDPTSTLVSSVQNESHTDATSNTSYTDTITAIAPEHTILVYNGCTIATGTSATMFTHTLVLTNATTVTLTRGNTSPTTRTCNYEVLSLAAGLLNGSEQPGTTSLSSTASGTQALSYKVNTAKSFVNFSGFLTANSAPNTTFPTVTLTNGTTVTTNLNAAGSSTTTQSVVQFN